MARFARILTISALLLPLAVPAVAHEATPQGPCRVIRGQNTPDDPSDDVSVCRQDVWFHQAETKLGNVAATGQGRFPSFNNVKPDESVTSGAGGGYLASSPTHQQGTPFDERLTATFDGAFTGDIDNLAVTAFFFTHPAEEAQSIPTIAINARLLVDGQPIAEIGGAEITRKPGGQAAKRIDFAFTRLYDAMKSAGLNGQDRQHQVRFQVMGTGIATEAALFVYDTSEVPSGMVFNIEPENLAPYTVIEV